MGVIFDPENADAMDFLATAQRGSDCRTCASLIAPCSSAPWTTPRSTPLATTWCLTPGRWLRAVGPGCWSLAVEFKEIHDHESLTQH